MKEAWEKPEIDELNVTNTEYYASEGNSVDGQYVSIDGKTSWYTFSGKGHSKDKDGEEQGL